jgi:Kdo2-lipid IVA lauroyltransferase/acyltransferase
MARRPNGARPVLSMKHVVNTIIGFFAVTLLKTVRLTNPDRLANIGGAIMRRIGPWLPEHRVGRANIAAAFPEKSAAERERILLGSWDNLGRVAAEFAHLDRLWDYDPARANQGRVLDSDEAQARLVQMRDDGKPALVFSAHLANWELPAVAATFYGVDTTVLYRPPNVSAIADAVIKMRAGIMGRLIPTGLDAPVRVAEALERGSHVAMLVDQYATRGVDVTFFGRPARTNPLIARLVQHFDCPIYGAHIVRHPGNRFRVELTEPIAAVRDAQGNVDITATMQRINDVIEGWVRAHPEQWLWLHRRWR